MEECAFYTGELSVQVTLAYTYQSKSNCADFWGVYQTNLVCIFCKLFSSVEITTTIKLFLGSILVLVDMFELNFIT